MNIAELQKALDFTGGKLNIYTGTLTENINELLMKCYESRSLTIRGVKKIDKGADRIAVEGVSDFFNCPDLKVSLEAWIDSGGLAQIYMEYQLPTQVADRWKFSRSFPNMPTLGYDNVLDEMTLSDCAFIVTSLNCEKETAQLKKGANFFGKMRPDSILSVLGMLLDDTKPLTLSGVINRIPETGKVIPLKPNQYAWDVDNVPGIFLNADLHIDYSISNIKLRDVGLKIYMPTDYIWLRDNATYLPTFAYTGRVETGSLGIAMDITACFEPRNNLMFLDLDFEKLSISNLAKLADFCGDSDLMSQLPDGIDILGRIELDRVILTLRENLLGITLEAATITIGVPDLKWEVWEDHFSVDNISFDFFITSPFSDPSFDVDLRGMVSVEGIRLNVMASSFDGFTLTTELADKVTIKLSDFMSKYVPDIPAPSDLTIDRFKVAIAPSKYYQMAVVMAEKPNPWTLDVGFGKLTISGVMLFVTYSKNKGVTGSFSGTMRFGDFVDVSVIYEIPGHLVIRSFFPEINLTTIIKTLCNQNVTLPNGFDLDFVNSSVMLEKYPEGFRFMFGTHLKDFGALALDIRKASSGDWGICFGISLTEGKGSRLPALKALKVFEDMFTLDSLVFVYSSFKDVSFTFPDMAKFNNPQIANAKLSLPGGGVIAGINFYGKWKIDSENKEQGLLKKILGLTDTGIGITLQIGKNPSEDLAFYTDFETVIAGHPLKCKFGAKMAGGNVGLFLEGAMDFSIQNQIQHFAVQLAFVTNGAYISATAKGNVPIDFGPFKLGNLAVEIGFNFAGVPSFGIAGEIASGGFHSSVAVFFDSGNPKNSMVAGAVSDLSLANVFDTFIDVPNTDIYDFLDGFALRGTHEFTLDEAIANDLDNLDIAKLSEAFAKNNITIPSALQSVFFTVSEKGKTWFLTDLTNRMRHYQLRKKDGRIVVSVEAQFYCAPQNTSIGTLMFNKGFYLNACLEFFGWKAWATVDINSSYGFKIDAQMDKMVIGNEKLFCVKASKGEGGPVLSVATYDNPHLYVNGMLSILGITHEIFISASKNGLIFDLKNEFFGVLKLNIYGSIGGDSYLDIGGGVDASIGSIDLGPLGKIDINTGVSGQIRITVNKTGIKATLDTKFTLFNTTHKLFMFDLDISTDSLKQLPSVLWEKVKSFLKELFSDPKKWALHVAGGVIEGVKDIAEVLVDVFGVAVDEASEIIQYAFETANKVCSAATAVISM